MQQRPRVGGPRPGEMQMREILKRMRHTVAMPARLQCGQRRLQLAAGQLPFSEVDERRAEIALRERPAPVRILLRVKCEALLEALASLRWLAGLARQDAEMGERSLKLSDVLQAPGSPDPESESRDHLIRSRLQDALDALPEGQREVFVLANNHGMKYQEISAVLGIPEGTVKSRMHNAVRTLRDDLQDLVEL